MGAHRYQSTWRSIIFNRVYDDSGLVDDPAHLVTAYKNSDYRLEEFDPTTVQVEDYRELRAHLEGAEPNQSFEGVRFLVGRGLILGSSAADLEDKTWALYEAFSPAACRAAFVSNDPPGVAPFSFKRATAGGSKALRFYAKPAAGRPVVVGRMREGLARRFLFQLVALDPFAYDESETQTAVAVGGGSVTNPGNVYSKPKIRITMSGAGSASFTITNSTTGQTLGVSLATLANNDVVIIDVARSLITVNGADGFARLVSGFPTNMILNPGVNTFAFTNTTNVASVRVDHRGAYA